MADIKDKVLFSKKGSEATLENEEWRDKPLVSILLNFVRAELAATGDREWMLDATNKKSLQLSEVEGRAVVAANFFQRKGVRRGDVVQIVLPNCVEYHVATLGAWLLGAAVSLSDPGLSGKILCQQLNETRGRIVVCQGEKSKTSIAMATKGTGITIVTIDEVFGYEASARSKMEVGAEVDKYVDLLLANARDSNATAVIFWSSGTTGVPKGIQHTENFPKYGLRKSAFPPGTLLQSTCFYHTGGFFAPLDGGLYNGFRTVFLNPNADITMPMFFEAIDKYRSSVIVCGSHHAVQLAGHDPDPGLDLDLSCVQIVAPMGAGVHAGIIPELKARFPKMMPAVLGFYGMSEIGTVSTSMSPENLGALAQGCQAKVVGDNGELLGHGEIGEILVKTPTMMKGYLNRKEENDKFFDDPHGFARTGDLGYYDEQGVLHYHARKKELIKYKNYHLYPADVEAVVIKHPDVVEVGVYGIPDPTVQERVAAVVVKKPGSKITEKELLNFSNSRLEDVKHIRGGIKFVDTIPRNPQGKILRAKLTTLN